MQLRQEISIPGRGLTDIEKIRIKRDASDVVSLVDLSGKNSTNLFGKDPSYYVDHTMFCTFGVCFTHRILLVYSYVRNKQYYYL